MPAPYDDMPPLFYAMTLLTRLRADADFRAVTRASMPAMQEPPLFFLFSFIRRLH